jgi:hypothetical protein
VDDILCAGEKEEVEWAYKIIKSELKIEIQGKLKKYLCIWYNIFGSLQAKDGERYL